MKSLAPNTLLQNRYLVVHLIGKGGMGDVYLAVDQRLGSAVALKRTFFSDDEMLGNAFEREAKTLARLRHPVLPKVSDHFTENEEQYLVMEHISGEDLSKRLEAQQKAFPLSWVLFWADQLLDALAYLHAHEPPIIHRDIKPQNLKLTDENHIILLDFGLSKNNVGETRALTSGRTGSVVGYTPHYAPMEQIRGTGTNPKSDLYALSATLYQLMTNVVPADSLTRADALLNDMSDPVKSLNEINPEVPKTVSAVILKGMEISQDKRFGTAREMQKALRDAFANMQSAMSAQTVAFNLQDEPIAPVEISPKQPEASKAAAIEEPPAPSLIGAEISDRAAAAQEADFDATLRMDQLPSESAAEHFPAQAASKQSDVKTEVFLAGALPEIHAPEKNQTNGDELSGKKERQETPQNHFADDFAPNKSDDANRENAFAPNETVPNFSFDVGQNKTNDSVPQPGDSMFFTNPNVGNFGGDPFATVANIGGTAGDAPEPVEAKTAAPFKNSDSKMKTPPPASARPAVKKSSGSKKMIGAGVGALIGLLILIAVGAGAAFFYANKSKPEIVETPPPTPLPTIEVSPTPLPTPETAVQSDTNTAVNANSAVTSEVNAANVNSAATAENAPAETEKTPAPRESAVRPTPPVVRQTPNRGASTPPVVRQTPRPSGKKGDRTVILQ